MKSNQLLIWGMLVLAVAGPIYGSAQPNPKVVMETSFGDMVIELFPDAAPVTVDNFLNYTTTGFYNGLLIHRVDMHVDTLYPENSFFVIQGGAYLMIDGAIYMRTPGAPIINESYNGLSNLRGTIAMARSGEPDSATSQFFFNQQDNTMFDRDNYGDGYFGKIVQGLDVMDAIAQTPVIDFFPGNKDPFDTFPYDPNVLIYSTYAKPCDLSYCSDLNFDGIIDLKDFSIFSYHWLDNDCNSSNDFCGGADFNYNSINNGIDFGPFVNSWLEPVGQEPEASDIDCNGQIDFADFERILSHWLETGCNPDNNFCDFADMDRSGTVDMVDFAIFSNSFYQPLSQ